jgi:hypothetical protein
MVAALLGDHLPFAASGGAERARHGRREPNGF